MTKQTDFDIYQGATWSEVYTHKSGGSAVDLTGYSARMGFRRSIASALEAYLSTGSDADVGTISLGGATGEVTMSMTAEESADLLGNLVDPMLFKGAPDESRVIRLVFDLELISAAGVVTRALEGYVNVHREVTR